MSIFQKQDAYFDQALWENNSQPSGTRGGNAEAIPADAANNNQIAILRNAGSLRYGRF